MFKREYEFDWVPGWKRLGLFILLVTGFQAHLYAEVKTYQLDAAQSKVLFEVGSTLHDVHGRAKSFASKVVFDQAAGKVSLPMQIEIAVDSMDTDNQRRDKGMREMFESQKYPVIRWTATRIDCRPAEKAESVICDAAGVLEIRNIKHENKFQVLLTPYEGQIQAKGSLDIRRKDFDLKTPSLLGIVRVSQEIKVNFETIWDLKKA